MLPQVLAIPHMLRDPRPISVGRVVHPHMEEGRDLVRELVGRGEAARAVPPSVPDVGRLQVVEQLDAAVSVARIH